MSDSAPIWDIFCRVIDNYGDAAIGWRLARQLDVEHRVHVRLWIDQPHVLHALEPCISATADFQANGSIEIRHWKNSHDAAMLAQAEPPDVVVEAFGCGLDEEYQKAIARNRRSIWIVLEYLSAETWVTSRHGLPSPHPSLSVERYFFFPGFVDGTGGLLREAGLDKRWSTMQAASVLGGWDRLGGQPDADALKVSLFGYENRLVLPMLECWSTSDQPVVAVIPKSKMFEVVAEWIAEHALEPGRRAGATVYARGNLELRCVPFLSQSDYDRLLRECDWNFVRGEDSFVRAQWAARPFAWQIYPQDQEAHRIKLEAFLDIYCTGLPSAIAKPLTQFWLGWNGLERVSLEASWSVLCNSMEVIRKHALAWEFSLRRRPDLARQLMQFWRDKVQ